MAVLTEEVENILREIKRIKLAYKNKNNHMHYKQSTIMKSFRTFVGKSLYFIYFFPHRLNILVNNKYY